MNIAILSPSRSAYSETFIQAHRNLSGNTILFFEGEIPKKVEGQQEWGIVNFVIRLGLKLGKFVSNRFPTYDEYKLKRNLLVNKIDLVLAEYGTTGAASLAVVKELGLPMITHFHGYDAHIHRIVKQHRTSYEQLFSYCNYIIVVSQVMSAQLINLGCPPAKLVVNPCGPGKKFLNAPTDETRSFFLFVGRFVEKKAPLIAVQALQQCLKRFPGAVLQMAGEGPLLRKVEEYVQEHDLKDNVVLLGRQEPMEILNLMVHALALVQHSVTASNGDMEGTPVTVMEAMAASLPVVGTKHAGIKDVVVHEETGFLVDEFDSSATAHFMQLLLEDPELAARMGEKGRRRITEKFSIDRHLSLIDRLIERSLA